MSHPADIRQGDKLFLVARADLPPGAQAVQACHALTEFQEGHPDVYASWFTHSNYLAFLSVPDEAALRRLLRRAEEWGVPSALFREPDLGNSLTAIALGPCREARRITKNLPLALRA